MVGCGVHGVVHTTYIHENDSRRQLSTVFLLIENHDKLFRMVKNCGLCLEWGMGDHAFRHDVCIMYSTVATHTNTLLEVKHIP